MRRVNRLPIFWCSIVVSGIFLVLARPVPSATTCVGQEPLKPVRRICGVVFFASGDRAENATVSVLQENKEVAVQHTARDGKFSFDQLNAGHYELRISVHSLSGVAGTKVVLRHPSAKSSQEIAVNFFLGSASCSSFSLVDSKQFDAGLNPVDLD